MSFTSFCSPLQRKEKVGFWGEAKKELTQLLGMNVFIVSASHSGAVNLFKGPAAHKVTGNDYLNDKR